MQQDYFKNIDSIKFEGKESDNPLAYKYYDANRMIMGKSIRDHFKFAMCYWHSMNDNGTDPFGRLTNLYPWNQETDVLKQAKNRADAAFEFLQKMGFDYFCFHDIDLIQEAPTLLETEKRIAQILDYIKTKQKETGIKVLWGTANCFSNPVYMNGAITNPDFRIASRAAAQIKIAFDASMELGAENYVFWGGREGYLSLLNTDMKRELDHLAVFFNKMVEYSKQQGFKGNFFIEPKPSEPTKHQYDFDSATVVGFLNQNGLQDHFKLNIEVNHATLAQHTFQHELQVAANAGMLGSIDANRGDYQNGWDTDQFSINLYESIEAMLVFLKSGGLKGGGINFDAKVRRNSTDLEDLFIAHIQGADIFARALIASEHILTNTPYSKMLEERYKSYDSGHGKGFENGELSIKDLYKIGVGQTDFAKTSGKQELYESILANSF
ncbi:MAG: xylose isomerase [Bacteroidota bacterium]|nr:xylose isomerase [Bacteroidota bacterium]